MLAVSGGDLPVEHGMYEGSPVLGRDMITGPVILGDLYAPIAADLKRVERVIEDELFSRHPFINDLCTRVGRYRGKMLRPAMVLLTGKAAGDLNDAHDVLAAVVEIVHLATLVHDDVLDEAVVRRKHRTINAADGNLTAVLLGDYLISHAYHLCSSLEDQYAARAIGATTNTVCEGELMEIHHRHDDRLDETAYFDIIRAKTAALTGASCALGARYAHAGDAVVRAMREYGISAGIAFQIVDDIIDLTGDDSCAGKTLGMDLAHGSATLPILHGLRHCSPAIRERLAAFVRGESAATREEIKACLANSGSIRYAYDVAAKWVQTALDQLQLLSDGSARDSLAAMTEFIIRRQF